MDSLAAQGDEMATLIQRQLLVTSSAPPAATTAPARGGSAKQQPSGGGGGGGGGGAWGTPAAQGACMPCKPSVPLCCMGMGNQPLAFGAGVAKGKHPTWFPPAHAPGAGAFKGLYAHNSLTGEIEPFVPASGNRVLW